MPQSAATDWSCTRLGEVGAKGTGREIVWLHGWGQTHAAFLPLAKLYERTAHSTLYDLPGFGETPMLAEGAGTADYADALAEILKKDDGPRIIAGHSFGCRVAVQLAARHPALVERLILIAAAGIPRKRSLAWKLRGRYVRLLGKVAGLIDTIAGTTLRARWVERFGSADYKNAGPLRATFVRVVNENLSTLAASISVPVALIFGAEDSETPPEIGEAYKRAFPNAELHVLEGYGHHDILSRGIHQCQRLIDRFLEGASTP